MESGGQAALCPLDLFSLPQGGLVSSLLLNIIIKISFSLRIINVPATFSTISTVFYVSTLFILILPDCLTRH